MTRIREANGGNAGSPEGEEQDLESTTVLPEDAAESLASEGEDISEGIGRLKEALDAARAAAEENRDKYLRTAAELENVRKRASRDLEKVRRFGLEKFAAEMLVVKDSMELGLEAAESADAAALREGMEATLKMLEKALAQFDVEEIAPEPGEPFDPEVHEAMSTMESAELEPNSILEMVQKGYQISGRLLRPARVVVSREPEAAPEAGGD